jgi:sensor histidine kinase YesM
MSTMNRLAFRLPAYFGSQSRKMLLLVLPWFVPIINYGLYGKRYVTDLPFFLKATLPLLVVVTGTFAVYDTAARAIIRRYPELSQTPRRVLLNFGFLAVFTTLVELLVFWFYQKMNLLGYAYTTDDLIGVLVKGRVGNVVIVILYESFYALAKWQENRREAEQLKLANLESQYESLKAQVNPHFLFNSLNSLSSLIGEDPEKAEEFVDEMARVYRYLLRANDAELTPLATEMNFIRSYFHLLKTRHGAGIALREDIDPKALSLLLPPLTLQMLVENAAKHNVLQASKPLTLEIFTTPDGCVVVRNNIQRKTTRVLSNQVGLTNITAKYQLLSQRDVLVHDDGVQFTVTIPLLPNSLPA